MIVFRIVLGLAGATAISGVIVLARVGRVFAFGAPPQPGETLETVALVAGLVVMLAGLAFPQQRALMHAGAAVAVGLAVYCVLQLTPPTVFGLAFVGAWLVFYARATWS